MRKMVITFLALGLVVASTAFASNAVRISQVYGGGGGGTVWTSDYVELFNNTGTPIAIGGWSIQYGSSTGTSGLGASATNCAFIPTGAMIPACGYYLLAVGSTGGSGVTNPWPVGGPDFTNTAGPAMSGTSGKLALCNDSVFPTACSGNTTGGHIVDALGYGTSANCYETTPTSALTTLSVAVRNGGGVTDNDVNSTDFTLTGTNSVVIHNSQSAGNPDCLIVPATSHTWGQVKTLYR